MLNYGCHRSETRNALKNNGFSAKSAILPAIALGLVSASGPALANVKDFGDENLSISTRLNPAYDPQGYRMGDINFRPSLTNALKHTDNVYATNVNQIHDLIYTVKPSIDIKSDFVRHDLHAGAWLEKGTYRDISSEDYEDWSTNVGGRLDLTGQTSMPVDLSFTRQHVRRGSPDERSSLKPSMYSVFEGTMSLIHQGQTLAMKVIANLKRFVFDDTIGLAGTIDNGDRDRNRYNLYTSVGMNSEAFFAPYVYSNIVKLDYDRAFDDNNFNRDSFEYEGGVGTIINFSDITRASFTVGRVHRDMQDRQFDDISAMTYGVNLIWEPSTLASFLLEGDRTIQESTGNNVSASVDSALRLTVNYELFPNLIVQPSAGVVERDYKGGAGGKTQTLDGRLQMTYKMNQNMWFTTTYQYINQDLKESGPGLTEYKSNTYGVSMKLQF